MLKRIAITGGLEASYLLRSTGLMGNARGHGAIFTLHHVRPYEAENFEPNAHLEITPAFLDETLGQLKHDGYRFVALGDVPGLLSDPAPKQPFAAFTLDDGYHNNLAYALPVFEPHAAPFTVFVAKGLAERSHSIWWETLAVLLRRANRFVFDFGRGEETLDTSSPAARHQAFSRFAAYLHNTDEARAVAKLDALALEHGIDPIEIVDDLVMGPSELNLLDASPLASLGAHTVSHRALRRLSEADARIEMEASADYVAAVTGRRPETIAFPYGTREAATDREAAIAGDLGFKLAVTTQPGLIAAGSRERITYLPRLSINGLYQKRRYVSALASGIPLRLMGK